MSNSVHPLRLAMWSGPRNISTAMMRSWGNRADTAVVDEPFYGFYLEQTGKEHPGAAEIIARTETSPSKIIAALTGPVPRNRAIFYQKQMTHHLLAEIDWSWILGLTNCFLIRDPAEVILSYLRKNDTDLVVEDLGFVQQLNVFEYIRKESAIVPPVLDADDILRDPEGLLRQLCRAVRVDFDPAMLSWPEGLRDTDGIWATHWYSEVARSTGFQPYRAGAREIPDRFQEIHQQCRACYDQLYQHRIVA